MPTTKYKGAKFILLMTILVVSGFAIIIFLNFASQLGIVSSRYITPDEVRGMAVEHNKLLYTLNFKQQNTLVDIFNNSTPVSKDIITKHAVIPKNVPQISQIVIYRFNAPDISIVPIGYVSTSSSAVGKPSEEHFSMVFSVTDWNPEGYLEEAVPGKMIKVLANSYDP